MSSEASALNVAPGRRISRSHPTFFFAAHVVLLVVVLLGFSPSFYLRSAFHHVTQLPALLYVHGAVLTVWFLLTVVQGRLIRTQRQQLHRRFGYVAAGYAAVVIVFGTLANLRLISEIDSPADGGEHCRLGEFFHPRDVCSVRIARCRVSQKAGGSQATDVARIDVYCRPRAGASSSVAHICGWIGGGKNLRHSGFADHVCFTANV